MKFIVNGQNVPISQVARKEMNFGQSLRPEVEPLIYELEVEMTDVVERLKGVYAETIKDDIAHYRFYKPRVGDSTRLWGKAGQLHALGYPPLDQLARDNQKLLCEIIEWLADDALDAFLPTKIPATGYAIATLDRVEARHDAIWLYGFVFRFPPNRSRNRKRDGSN